MNTYQRKLERIGGKARIWHIEALSKEASESGEIFELGRAFLISWNFQESDPRASDKVLRVLERAGLRREAFRRLQSESFSGSEGWRVRLKRLMPLPMDRNDKIAEDSK